MFEYKRQEGAKERKKDNRVSTCIYFNKKCQRHLNIKKLYLKK